MTVAEYLLIVLNKSEMMEAEENERLGIVDCGDDLGAIEAGLRREEAALAKAAKKTAHP